jgi:hypothetical protein
MASLLPKQYIFLQLKTQTMSGLRNSTERFEYLNFSKGKIVLNGEQFDEFEGRVLDIKISDDEYQGEHFKKIGLLMRDDTGKQYLLNMKMNSGYGVSFCMLVPNIEWMWPIIISGFSKEVEGKKKTGIFIKQRGVFIKWHFTKDNPGELPSLKKVKYKGHDVWDSSDQQNYFLEMLAVVSHELSKVKNTATSDSKPPEVSAAAVTENLSPVDDLPF